MCAPYRRGLRLKNPKRTAPKSHACQQNGQPPPAWRQGPAAVDPVAGLIIKGIIHRAAPKAVVVGFGVGGIAGVEIIRHLLRCQCPHIHGQAGVQRQRDALHRDAAIIMEVQGKPPGMHSSIGARTALYIGPGAEHALHSILHHRTHRNPIGLPPETPNNLCPCRQARGEYS